MSTATDPSVSIQAAHSRLLRRRHPDPDQLLFLFVWHDDADHTGGAHDGT